MHKILRFFLAFVMAAALWPTLKANAATEDYPAKYLPLVEVKINVGNTELADSAFLESLIAALKAKGLGASKISVEYASTVHTDFPVTDPTNWLFYDHFGWWNEVGAQLDFDQLLEDYLIAHLSGWDGDVMYYEDSYFDPATKMLSIEYYDGNDYKYFNFKDLSSLITKIKTKITDYEVEGWVDSLSDEAEALLATDPIAIEKGVNYIDYMWYDHNKGKAYVGWYDSSNNWFETEFPDYLTYISKVGFLNTLELTSDYEFNDEDGYVTFYDSVNDDRFYITFSSTEYTGVELTHYPSPDENPDGDNPINWKNDPHIVIHDDGKVAFYGYGSPSYKDFMLSKNNAVSDKHFSFDLDESNVSYHSMQGGGFLFSIELNDQSTVDVSDDTMSGYAVLFTDEEAVLYSLSDVNVAEFHNVDNSYMEDVSGVSILATGEKDTENMMHSIKIDIVNNILTVLDNDVASFDGVSLETIGNRFGPLVSYSNHDCSELSYFIYDKLKMGSSVKVVSKAQDNVGDQNWTDGAYHVYINLEDTNDTSLIVKDFTDALKDADSDYIGIGKSASKTMHNAIIDGNGFGKYFEFATYPQDEEALANDVADYIWPLLEDLTIENIKNAILQATVHTDLPVEPFVVIPKGVIDAFDDLAAGNSVELDLDVNLIELVNVPVDDESKIDTYHNGLANKDKVSFFYLDLSLIKIVNGTDETAITSTLKPIQITITIPANLQSKGGFKIIRVHDGVLTVLNSTYDAKKHTITFSTDKFSTYAIQYNTEDLPDTGEAANAGMILLLGAALLLVLSRKTKTA